MLKLFSGGCFDSTGDRHGTVYCPFMFQLRINFSADFKLLIYLKRIAAFLLF